MLYKNILKPLLFSVPPEKAHHFTAQSVQKLTAYNVPQKIISSIFELRDPLLETQAFGLKFKNPVGLAAGFDKDAAFLEAMSAFGFGFLEVGTVTPKPQAGNQQPRLFRLTADEALINRMGFNNGGVAQMTERLKNRKTNLIVGGNIGKNKSTPNQEAHNDYLSCFRALFPYVDYFTVNISSPNTPNLRKLQEKEPLLKLLAHLQAYNQEQTKPKPILLKISPDLSNHQLQDIISIVRTSEIQGVIATNTTIGRENLLSSPSYLAGIGAGGLSGKPLAKRATEVIRFLAQEGQGDFTIVGAGGISSAADALEKLEAGATLLQIYTGLVYHGPNLIKHINAAILAHRQKKSGK